MTQTGAAAGSRSVRRRARGSAALTLGALGVVFGDIGTSPLYTLSAVFDGPHSLPPTTASVFGALSLVFWSLMLLVSLEFVALILRADNDGEGGIMALVSFVQRDQLGGRRWTPVLVALGAFGAALFFGDGAITPAISVLSAVEGLEEISPSLDSVVLPVTVVIVVLLFSVQRFGTATIGRVFGPVMAAWFVVLAVLGAAELVQHPGVLRALSPTYAAAFLVDQPGPALLSLGGVVLAVTGCEALYSDLGHFGRSAIQRAWVLLVLPCLVINYFGQGARILREPGTAASPLYGLVPGWALVPVVALATLAAVIAAQAVISGMFSLTHQAVQLGFLPAVEIRHTSEEAEGQIYVPVVNWTAMVAVLALVIAFGSSKALASAYGIAVTGTLLVDTILFFVVVRVLWRKPRWMVGLGVVAFGAVDLAFLGSNLTKLLSGGWLSLVVALAVYVALATWRRGRELLTSRELEEDEDFDVFLAGLAHADPPVVRVPGTAVFLDPGTQNTPLALRRNVERNHVLHEHVLVVRVAIERVPHVPEAERCAVTTLVLGVVHIRVRFGFRDRPDLPAALALAARRGLDADLEHAAYFTSHLTVTASSSPGGMSRPRKRLFALMSRNARNPAAYFSIPPERVTSLGEEVVI